jgi:predicted translin family RNA/ssDNA-binding protein
MTSAELDAMKAVVQRYPYSGAMMRFASALALNGRLNEAQDTLRRLRTIHGELVYQQLRSGLRRQVEEGESDLRGLERSLPL